MTNSSTLIESFTSELDHYLELHSSALNHILYGDITDRVSRQKSGTTLEKIINGGLHTYDGWESFSLNYPDLVHICNFNSKLHSSWYYARELQNGIITLRVPEHIFSSKAAKITKFPDNYYKSGYLWKTLFSKGFGKEDLIKTIEEALNNINKESSKEGEIIGYTKINNPLRTVRVVILYRDNKINSVFPSWTQPNTGNNGKVFSHFESIGHVINSATIFIGDKPTDITSCIDNKNVTRSLIDITPNIFLVRPKPNKNIIKWRKSRELCLKKHSDALNKNSVLCVYKYITNFEICKNYDLISKDGYNKDLHLIEKSLKAFNAVQIHQNIIDSITNLYLYDNLNKTNQFHTAILYLLKNMITFSGVDSWIKRKIYHKIISLLPTYHSVDATKDFICFLSESPSRRELFVEFSFDSQVKKELKGPFNVEDIPDELLIISGSAKFLKIKYNHFVEYLKENLGENYLLHFNNKERTIFVSKHIESGGKNHKILISDVIRYFVVSDFDTFSEDFSKLIEHLIANNTIDDVKYSVQIIMRDYCRIQFAQRLRSNLLYKDYLNFEEDIGSTVSNEYIQHTILKHERMLNTWRVKHFLDSVEKLCPLYNDLKFSREIEMYRDKATKEIPPLPEVIPEYIEKRRK
ncbi:MAG: hypothetical protein KAH20_14880 [Methylococcales bacterium]|nr:hypothetical protein [Methylococcales bacterium]